MARVNPDVARTLRAQIGQFAMVPVWLLDKCQESRPIHLYALLGKYSNRERRAWPSMERLAREMASSERTVERAVKTLRGLGALQTERRHRPDGAVIGLDFLLVQIAPGTFALPDTGVGLVPPSRHGCRDHPDTGVGKGLCLDLEPDPLEPDHVQAAAASPPPPAERADENPDDNVGVITKLAHVLLDLYEQHDADFADFSEVVKWRCAKEGIAYNSEVVTKAIESACYQRQRIGKSVIPGAAGAAAARLTGNR